MYRLKEKTILLSPLMSSQISQYSEIEPEVRRDHAVHEEVMMLYYIQEIIYIVKIHLREQSRLEI